MTPADEPGASDLGRLRALAASGLPGCRKAREQLRALRTAQLAKELGRDRPNP